MPTPPEIRALYRRLLRELPSREPNILANRSPIQQRIRSAFASSSTSKSPFSATTSAAIGSTLDEQHDIAEQLVQYLRAQRTHTTLLERYNPGMNMTEEDRVRMTARRVGMDIPEELRINGGWRD